MANFPNFTPLNPYEPQFVDNVLRTDTEGGYINTRPKYTRIKRKFTLNYYLTDEEHEEFVEFYTTEIKASGSFNFTEPITGTTRVCIFSEVPKETRTTHNHWEVSISIIEV